MSLIPYTHDSQAVVLRRGDAVVVYDTDSHQLLVRDAADQVELTICPYCHRPLQDARPSSEHNEERGRASNPARSDRAYVDPKYFAMLAASQQPSPASSGNSTPIRRFIPPALRSGRSRDVSGSEPPPSGAEFVTSEPKPSSGQGFSSSAFSPGFFRQNFREERELGRGGNGVVLLVEHLIGGWSMGHFACKRIPVGDSQEYFEKVVIEVRLLQDIPHQNLVRYHWSWLENHQSSTFGPSIPHLWILQDFCNAGDLQTYVLGPTSLSPSTEHLKERMRRKSKGESSPPRDLLGPSKLSFEEIFSFFRDITSGLHHLHSKGYIHRDLKPSNCLLHQDDGRTRVLISDFGEVQRSGTARSSSGATGTISYCAPEVLQQRPDGSFGNFTAKSDVFSLGMIVYFMCFGRLPYNNADNINEENEDLNELRAEIMNWPGFNETARARPDLPEKLYRYLKRLLSVSPDERPSTVDILANIKGGASLGDSDWIYEDYSPRVSSLDSPRPMSKTRDGGKQSAHLSRPGLGLAGRRNSSEGARSRSPTKNNQNRRGTLNPLNNAIAFKPRGSDTTSKMERPLSPQQSPRLMLGPPPAQPTVSKALRIAHDSGVVAALRVALFLTKVLSVSLPCRPYTTNPWILYPVLGLAVLDLGLVKMSMLQSLLLFGTHITIVFIARRQGQLCEAARLAIWEAH